ncbi:MAG: TIGR02757 family protein [Flavobacterium sp.]|nr:TIGR02757 family protein [Flavobacterium sp.]
MTKKELKDFLDEKVSQYNTPQFIDSDPIQIPHLFSGREDIEVSGFLAATIAWGNRTMIIRNSKKIIELMGNAPYDFVMSHSDRELQQLSDFVHRTFNGGDLVTFVTSLKHIYSIHGGPEAIFAQYIQNDNLQPAIHEFKKAFFEVPHLQRTQKHVGDPARGSSAKRINMFLRWMVRNDNCGVDFGLWDKIPPSALSCPLDVHSGNVARKLGLLNRKQNDAKAVAELDLQLRSLDKNDPVKYDFALFGLGVFEKF